MGIAACLLTPILEWRVRTMHGTIARMVPEEGFGFIDGDDGHEYFFHRTALNATRFEHLPPGVPVYFRLGHAERDRPDEAPRAVLVRMAHPPELAVHPPPHQEQRCAGLARTRQGRGHDACSVDSPARRGEKHRAARDEPAPEPRLQAVRGDGVAGPAVPRGRRGADAVC